MRLITVAVGPACCVVNLCKSLLIHAKSLLIACKSFLVASRYFSLLPAVVSLLPAALRQKQMQIYAYGHWFRSSRLCLLAS